MARSLMLLTLVAAMNANALAAVPDPYARTDQPATGPAPVPVMEQMFWVQVKLDPATDVAVTCPEGIKLLDRTKPAAGRQWTRFYFRADRGIPKAEILFTVAGRAPVVVPLRVLSYREDIEDKSRDLAGFTDAAHKRGRSHYTDAMIAQARANLASHPDLKSGLARKSKYETMSDDALWQGLPSWSVPRQLYGNWPCPFCGDKIYAKNAFYPWQTAGQFHSKCPLCKRVFPTNDVSKDDYTSGEFPDDGWGWDTKGAGARMDAAGWVAYAVEREWLGLGGTLNNLALRCLLQGDQEAGHRAGLLLARMAYVYPGMDMHWQQTRSKYLRVGKTSTEQQWDSGQLMVPALQAYDAIWDYLATDQRLADFLHAKDSSIRTPDDVRRLIDVYLVQHVGLNFMRRWYHGDNGGWEMRVAQIALAANMGALSDAWLREVFTHAYNTAVNEGGFQDSVLVNYLTREGPTNIGAFQYSTLAIGYLDELAASLARYPDPRWRELCNLYDEKRFPRFRAMFDAYLDMRTAGLFFPNYGDDFGNPAVNDPNFVANRRAYYLHAYEHWPTDRLARELAQLKERPVELFGGDPWPKVDAQAKRVGPAPASRSRVLDGVGMAFLESRADDPDLNRRAGLTLRYGYGWGHSHHDNLNIQFWAKGLCMVPELGYPNWVHPLGATGAAVHHVTGMIDGKSQYTGSTGKGALETFAAAPEASFLEVSAQPNGFDAKVYRRTVSLLDAPGGNCYVFDVLRLKGGTTRTYCFHGPAPDDFSCPLPFGEKGQPIFTNLMEPQRAKSDGDVTADWKCEGKPVHLKLHLIGATGREYVTARFGKVDSPPFRFLLAEDSAKNGASEFIAIWEPYEDKPFIEKIVRLPMEGGDEPDGFQPVALCVRLVGGQADYLYYAQNPVATSRLDNVESQGNFCYVSGRNGRMRCSHLVSSGLTVNSASGRGDMTAHRAKITAVDLGEYRVTLDHALPADGSLDGAQMNIIASGQHRSSYRIERVLPPGNVVQFGLSAKIFQSKLMAVDGPGKSLTCEVAPPTEVVRKFPPGYYNGALLTDESLRARYRVVGVDGKKILLDRAPAEADFAALDPFGRRMVHIFDFTEGDEVTIAASRFTRSFDDNAAPPRATPGG